MAKVFKEEQEKCSIIATYYAIEKNANLEPNEDKDLKSLFDKKGFIINWKALEKQSLEETINALSMASPFTLEEKQILLETKNLIERKNKLEEILITYTNHNFTNKTIQ